MRIPRSGWRQRVFKATAVTAVLVSVWQPSLAATRDHQHPAGKMPALPGLDVTLRQ